MSRSSFEEVSTTIGKARVRSSAFTRCSTSSPSTLGRRRSSRITLGFGGSRLAQGPVENKRSSASAPSFARTRLFASLCLRSARMQSSASLSLSSTRRISTAAVSGMSGLIAGGRGSHDLWDREVERGTFAGRAFRPDASALAGDDALDDGEADAGALEVAWRVQALKNAEQLGDVFFVEAHAVVLDAVDHLVAGNTAGHLDAGGGFG